MKIIMIFLCSLLLSGFVSAQFDTSRWNLDAKNMDQFFKRNDELISHIAECHFIHHKKNDLYGVSIYFLDSNYTIDFMFDEPIAKVKNYQNYMVQFKFVDLPKKFKRRKVKEIRIID